MSRTLAHARFETTLLLRNGEQLLLTVLIPLILLLAMTETAFVPIDGPRIDTAYPVVLTVSIIATCFTSLAIATGFERRSAAMVYLATTPLRRGELLMGKALATIAVTVVSTGIVTIAALILGWRPSGSALLAVALIALGMACFAAWGLAIASAFRAEAVLAIANALFLLLIIFGGVIVPATSLPLGGVIALLPSAALADSLRATIGAGSTPPITAVVVLAIWGIVGATIARVRFSWE